MPKIDYGKAFVELANKKFKDAKIIAQKRAEDKYPNNENKQKSFFDNLIKTYLLHAGLLKQENSTLPGVDALFEAMDEYYSENMPYWYLCVAMDNSHQMSHPAAVMYDGNRVVILIAKATSSSVFRGFLGLFNSISNSKNRSVEEIILSPKEYKELSVFTGGTLGSKVETMYLNRNWSILTDAAKVFHNELIDIINGNKEKVSIKHKSNDHPLSDKDVKELKNYKELLDSGIITQEEFEAKKKEILG